MNATDAFRLGLVHELVPFDLLWAKAHSLVTEISKGNAMSLALTKRILNETVGESLPTQLSSAAAMAASARTTEEAREGLAAFLEKRSPRWP